MGSIWTHMEEGLSRLQGAEAVERETCVGHTSYCFLYHELSLLTQKGFLEEEEFLGWLPRRKSKISRVGGL